jgi:hypothetical protein
MDKISTKTISQHLHSADQHLAQILAKAYFLQRVERLFKTLLQGELALHCRIANVKDQQLIIEVDSSAWATRLRYLCPSLVAPLRVLPGLEDLQEVRCYVKPN